MVRGKFIVVSTYIKKGEKFQVNNLTFTLRNCKIERKNKPKSSMKLLLKITVVMNETEIIITEKSNKTRSWFLQNISKVVITLARFTKKEER